MVHRGNLSLNLPRHSSQPLQAYDQASSPLRATFQDQAPTVPGQALTALSGFPVRITPGLELLEPKLQSLRLKNAALRLHALSESMAYHSGAEWAACGRGELAIRDRG